MQAQFYPPERPSNSSHPPKRPTGRREPSLPPRHQSNLNPVSSEVREAASGGDFRAIATILNSVLTPHDISAWVGEAGPGYLQVTLTVKRPPTQKPLVRLVSHQLYSLRSDVILGANVTVQVAQTNLILWNQLVRLPLPDIYKQPSKWDIWRNQLKEWQAEAGGKALATWTMSQRTINAWYEQGRSQWANGSAPEEENASDSSSVGSPESAEFPPSLESPQAVDADVILPHESAQVSTNSSSTVAPRFSSAVPPEILKQAQQHAQQVTQAQQQQQARSTIGALNDSQHIGRQHVDSQQWSAMGSAMAMVPGVVMPSPIPSPTASASAAGVENGLGLDTSEEMASDYESPAIGGFGGGGGGRFGGGFGTLRKKVVHQVMNPSPWMLGGAAIAAFLVGSALVDSLSSTSSADVDVQNNRPVPAEHPLPNSTAIPKDSNLNEGAQGSVPDTSNELTNTQPNPSDSASLDPTNRGTSPLSRSTHRPKTVEMHDQTIDVVPLIPTLANLSEVTLTFSGDAIVPLPSEPEKPQGWRSLFSIPAASLPSYPADIAMALIDQPSDTSTANRASVLTPQTLHQGGIDVVNIAGNNLAKSQDPSLRDTVHLLSQSAIRTVGAGLTEKKASQPQIFDIKGHRIAVLGYVDTHLYAADRDMGGNNPGSRRRLAADIEAIRDQVDWVIVSYHWSDVDTADPTEQQVRLAHLAVDEGADLVVGYHPDALQGGEIYNGRAIAYSLGQMPVALPQATAATAENPEALSETAPVTPNDHVLDNVPHQLPNSGIRTSPSEPDEASEASLNVNSNHTMATMLKVVLGDRHMGVEFVPVQTHSGLSEYAQGREGQTVLRTLKETSQTFDEPLSLNGMVHLPLSPNIRGFSNSAEESFQPDSADGFIDRAE